jgi:peroxiredoxin
MKDKFAMVDTPITSFSLPNSRGERVSIDSFKGTKNVVVSLLRDIH